MQGGEHPGVGKLLSGDGTSLSGVFDSSAQDEYFGPALLLSEVVPGLDLMTLPSPSVTTSGIPVRMSLDEKLAAEPSNKLVFGLGVEVDFGGPTVFFPSPAAMPVRVEKMTLGPEDDVRAGAGAGEAAAGISESVEGSGRSSPVDLMPLRMSSILSSCSWSAISLS